MSCLNILFLIFDAFLVWYFRIQAIAACRKSVSVSFETAVYCEKNGISHLEIVRIFHRYVSSTDNILTGVTLGLSLYNFQM